jgi:hypothetical protein
VKAAQEAFQAHIAEGFRAAESKLAVFLIEKVDNMLIDLGKPGADRSAVMPPIGEDLRPKDPIKLGVSPSTEVINMDCTHPDPVMVEYTIRQLKKQSEGLRNIVQHDKEHWEGFTAGDKEDD